jgi:hypothetical protein
MYVDLQGMIRKTNQRLDEESAFDLATRESEEEGKPKIKLEEATEGINPLRIFMGRLVSFCISFLILE